MELLLFRDKNISSVVEWLEHCVINTVSVQNLLAPFCCVLEKDTLRHFFFAWQSWQAIPIQFNFICNQGTILRFKVLIEKVIAKQETAAKRYTLLLLRYNSKFQSYLCITKKTK